MTDRTLAEAMGMTPQETAELRERAERLLRRPATDAYANWTFTEDPRLTVAR